MQDEASPRRVTLPFPALSQGDGPCWVLGTVPWLLPRSQATGVCWCGDAALSLRGATGAAASPEPVAHLLETLPRAAAPPIPPPRALRTPPQRLGLDHSHLRPGHRRGRGRGAPGDPLPPQPGRRRGLRGLHHQQRHPPLLQDGGTCSAGPGGAGCCPSAGRAAPLRAASCSPIPRRAPCRRTHPPPRAVQPPLCTQNVGWPGAASPEDLS